jgi:hypothetical protein
MFYHIISRLSGSFVISYTSNFEIWATKVFMQGKRIDEYHCPGKDNSIAVVIQQPPELEERKSTKPD